MSPILKTHTFDQANTLVHRFELKRLDVIRGKFGALFQTPVPVLLYVTMVVVFWFYVTIEPFIEKLVSVLLLSLLLLTICNAILPIFEFILLIVSPTLGVLGEHELELSDKGIMERTAVNEGLHSYAAIQAVRMGWKYLYIKMPGFQFHIIPLRSFDSREVAKEFCHEIKRRMQMANTLETAKA